MNKRSKKEEVIKEKEDSNPEEASEVEEEFEEEPPAQLPENQPAQKTEPSNSSDFLGDFELGNIIEIVLIVLLFKLFLDGGGFLFSSE